MEDGWSANEDSKGKLASIVENYVVSCGLIEADYGRSQKHSLGPFLTHEEDQDQTAHVQYRYKSNDIIMT